MATAESGPSCISLSVSRRANVRATTDYAVCAGTYTAQCASKPNETCDPLEGDFNIPHNGMGGIEDISRLGRLFGPDYPRRYADILDGTSNTAYVVEIGGLWHDGAPYFRGHWGLSWPRAPVLNVDQFNSIGTYRDFRQKPARLQLITNKSQRPEYRVGSGHPEGFHVLLVDGSVQFIAYEIDLSTLQALGTIQGGEPVSANDL